MNATPASTATKPPAGYRWGVVFMLWWICFFNYADRQALSAVMKPIAEEFHFDKVQQGLILSAFMWVYAAAAPLAGYIGDRVRRRDLILGGCLFWSFVTITTGWCSKLWHFVTVRALEGFGETFYFPASMSLVSDYHGKTRSRALALHQTGVYAGTIGGSWLGALLAEHYGWRSGFYLFGGLGMVLAVVLWFLLREPPRGGADNAAAAAEPALPFWETLAAMLVNRESRLLLLGFVGANFVATIFLSWAPTFLAEKFNYRLAAAGLNATLYAQLGMAVGAPLAGMLADRLVARHAGGRMWVQAAGLLVGAGFVWLVGRAPDRTTLLIALALFGVCKGFYDCGIFASLYDVVPVRARSTAAGVMNTVGWTGGALGPVYVGWMALHAGQGSEQANMSLAIALGGLVYLAAAVCLVTAALTVQRRSRIPV